METEEKKHMSKDMKEIIIDAKRGKGKVTKILEEQNEALEKEWERSQMERLLEEEKQKLLKLRQQQSAPLQVGQATNFLQNLFAGRSPGEIKEILGSLTPEDIDKIVAMNGNAFSDLRNLARSPSSDSKTVLEAVRTGVEVAKVQGNQGVDLKGMAEIFKAVAEATKAQQPSQPQANVYETLVKSTLDELKATREQMATQERLRIEKEIAELRARPSGIDDLLYNEEKVSRAKKIFGGTDSATANEFTLKKEEMQQKERLETRRMDIEEKKWDKEQEAGDRTVVLVKDVLSGPVGRVLERFGNAGADRVRGGPSKNALKSVQIVCANANCKKPFYADENALSVVCPHCGAVLEKQGSASPPPQPQSPAQPPQAEATQPTEATQPASEQQPPQPEQ